MKSIDTKSWWWKSWFHGIFVKNRESEIGEFPHCVLVLHKVVAHFTLLRLRNSCKILVSLYRKKLPHCKRCAKYFALNNRKRFFFLNYFFFSTFFSYFIGKFYHFLFLQHLEQPRFMKLFVNMKIFWGYIWLAWERTNQILSEYKVQLCTVYLESQKVGFMKIFREINSWPSEVITLILRNFWEEMVRFDFITCVILFFSSQ